MSKKILTVMALALVTSLVGVAVADRVVIEPPVFVPEAEFHHEDGYYRTREGHFYHYDRERNGWHYGRDHEEGVRYEREHHRH